MGWRVELSVRDPPCPDDAPVERRGGQASHQGHSRRASPRIPCYGVRREADRAEPLQGGAKGKKDTEAAAYAVRPQRGPYSKYHGLNAMTVIGSSPPHVCPRPVMTCGNTVPPAEIHRAGRRRRHLAGRTCAWICPRATRGEARDTLTLKRRQRASAPQWHRPSRYSR